MDKKVLMNEILTLLNKVNRQAQILVHLPNMARIDVDLLLAEIRQVYDKTLDLQLKVETTRLEPKTEPKPSHPISTIAEPNSQSSSYPVAQPEEPLLFPEPEILEPEIPKPVQPSYEEYSQPQQITTHPSTHPESGVNAASVAQPKSVHQAYEDRTADQSIASRLQYNPINDLRSAIGISDKFLLMSQLFNGSLEQYNAAIERLNNFYNYDDAEIFLGSLKILHDWTDELPAIERLLYLIRRRYQKE